MAQSPPPDTRGAKLFHEKQSLMRCALHTLNNFLQRQAFTAKDLDDICYSLTPSRIFNPHKNILGFGNYDVNVLYAALQLHGYDIVWYNADKSIRSQIEDLNVAGLIVNIDHHWFAIPRLNGIFYNMDSKLDDPQPFHDVDMLYCFLGDCIFNHSAHILLVTQQPTLPAAPSAGQ